MQIVRPLRDNVTYLVRESENGGALVARRMTSDVSIAEKWLAKNRKAVSGATRLPSRLASFSGTNYWLREWVEGRTLLTALSGASTEQCRQWLTEIRKAVSHLHKCGIVHGRLHPDNIIIDPGNHVVIVDPICTDQLNIDMGAITLEPRLMMISPGQLRTNKVTRADDIHALNVISHLLSTKVLPFTEVEPLHHLNRVLAEPIPSTHIQAPRSMHLPKLNRIVSFHSLRISRWTILTASAVIAIAAGLLWLRPSSGHEKLARRIKSATEQGDFNTARRLLHEAENEFPDMPIFTRLLGDLACEEEQQGACIRQYLKAIDSDDHFADDIELRAHTMKLLDSPAHRRQLMGLVSRLSTKINGPLLENTKNVSYWTRWNSVYALQVRGLGNKVDFVDVYGMDLLYAESCDTRRQAAERLAELGETRAGSYLAKARERVSSEAYERRCMRGAVDHALQTLRIATAR